MRLSTRFRYGTRFMINLAMAYDGGPVRMSDIVKRERVSKKYLEQIAYQLMSANLVKSVRGAKGGYILKRSPVKIKLIDIYNAIEGPLVLVKCLVSPKACSLVKTCAAREMWSNIQKNIEMNLTNNTLINLVKIKERKQIMKD